MTAPEREGLREAVIASEAMARHLERIGQAFRRGGSVPRPSEDDSAIERCHAFLRMFEQLYDVTARRLFRGALLLAREDHRALSYKAVVRRLETLEVLDDGDAWLNLGETRNKLIHDYAATPDAFADHLGEALENLDLLLNTHAALVQHLREEGLFS